jgi:hypothetical protein
MYLVPFYFVRLLHTTELVSILTCDLKKSKQANLAKNPLGGTGAGEALFRKATYAQSLMGLAEYFCRPDHF